MSAPIAIRLHPNDNVVVARMDILPNTRIEDDVAAATRVPPGHKILTRAVKKGEPLRKYNQIIGFATDDLAPGTHIHTHNCVMGDFERDYAFCADAHPTDFVPEHQRATFMGYRRADGRSATRNYIGIVTTLEGDPLPSGDIANRIGGFDDIISLERGSETRPPANDAEVAATNRGDSSFIAITSGGGSGAITIDTSACGECALGRAVAPGVGVAVPLGAAVGLALAVPMAAGVAVGGPLGRSRPDRGVFERLEDLLRIRHTPGLGYQAGLNRGEARLAQQLARRLGRLAIDGYAARLDEALEL